MTGIAVFGPPFRWPRMRNLPACISGLSRPLSGFRPAPVSRNQARHGWQIVQGSLANVSPTQNPDVQATLNTAAHDRKTGLPPYPERACSTTSVKSISGAARRYAPGSRRMGARTPRHEPQERPGEKATTSSAGAGPPKRDFLQPSGVAAASRIALIHRQFAPCRVLQSAVAFCRKILGRTCLCQDSRRLGMIARFSSSPGDTIRVRRPIQRPGAKNRRRCRERLCSVTFYFTASCKPGKTGVSLPAGPMSGPQTCKIKLETAVLSDLSQPLSPGCRKE